MNVKRIFWRIFFANHEWNNGTGIQRWFWWNWCPDQIGGVLYAGPTLFGISILYSTEW